MAMVRTLLVGMFVVFGLAIATAGDDPVVTVVTFAPLLAFFLGTAAAVRRGYERPAAWALTVVTYLFVFASCYAYGGLDYGNGASFVIVSMIAGTTISARAAIGFSVAAVAGVGLLLWLQLSGMLPEPPVEMGPTNAFISLTTTVVVVSLLFWLTIRSLQRAVLAEQRLAEERDQERARLAEAQKLEVVGRLASGVAHDFNNLLTVITAISPMLRESVAEEDDELVDEIDLVAERGALMCKRVLAFSGPVRDETEAVELRSTVEQELPLLSRLAGEGVQVDMELGVDPLWIELPSAGLGQILLNLLVNAREASEGPGSVKVSLERDGDHAVLTFADDGVGMTEEVRAQIFDPFFTTKATGTGLGLATVRELVTRNGGTIDVQSAPGVGTTFVLRFALSREAERLSGDVSRRSRRAPRQRRVLLVEDDPLVRRSTRRTLERSSFDVTAVVDGLEALALLDSGATFDVVVLDVNMPRLDGRGVAEALLERGSSVPLLVVSGDRSQGDIEAWGYPRWEFLPKPYRIPEMRDALERILASSEAESKAS